MHHKGMLKHMKKFHDKFKIDKTIEGDKLTITFSGDKEEVEKLDKKLDAMHVLMEDCCKDGEKCC